MDAYIAKSLAQRTFTLAMIGVFGSLELILASVGIYGVVSYSVSMRTREVGIRVALGAASQEVVLMILRQVSAKVFLGLAIGLCASLSFTRTLAAYFSE